MVQVLFFGVSCVFYCLDLKLKTTFLKGLKFKQIKTVIKMEFKSQTDEGKFFFNLKNNLIFVCFKRMLFLIIAL